MKFNNVDLNLLKVFITVYQEQSLRKAGEKLCVTTPAVSQNIKKLKHFLGEELFVLSGKRFMPTPYSDNLYLRVYPILEELIIAIEEGTQFVPTELTENFYIEVNPHVLPWITPNCISNSRNKASNPHLAGSGNSKSVMALFVL